MARFEIDVGAFPLNQRAVAVFYRFEDRFEFVEAGTFSESVFTVDVPEQRSGEATKFVLKVYAVDDRTDDTSPRSRSIILDVRDQVADSRAPSDITFPEPTIIQSSGSLEVTPHVPAGTVEGEFEFQIHHGRTGDSIEDSVFEGFAKANEPTRIDAWSGEEDQKIHIRPVRVEDDVAGDWQTTEIKVGTGATSTTEDHGTDFSGGTLLPIGTSSVTPLVLDGGDLVVRDNMTRSLFATTTRAQVGDAPRSQFRGTPAFGTYETELIVFTEAQQVAFEVFPEVAAMTRKTLTRADFASLSREEAREVGAEVRDTRIGRLSLTSGGDLSPLDIDVDVAVSDGDSPTFTDADFRPAQPGRLYIPRSYKMRVTLKSNLATQPKLSAFRIFRWCYETLGCAIKQTSYIVPETAHGRSFGDPVSFSTGSAWVAARADTAGTMPALGIVSEIIDADHFRINVIGLLLAPAHGLTIGARHFVAPTGGLTETEPTGGNLVQLILVPIGTNTINIVQFTEK